MDKNTIGGILALVALFALLAITGLLFFVSIPTANKDLVNVALMAIVSSVSIAFGFYLGSSLNASKGPTAPPLPPVDAPPVPGS